MSQQATSGIGMHASWPPGHNKKSENKTQLHLEDVSPPPQAGKATRLLADVFRQDAQKEISGKAELQLQSRQARADELAELGCG